MDRDDRHNPYPMQYDFEELVCLGNIQHYFEHVPIRYILAQVHSYLRLIQKQINSHGNSLEKQVFELSLWLLYSMFDKDCLSNLNIAPILPVCPSPLSRYSTKTYLHV